MRIQSKVLLLLIALFVLLGITQLSVQQRILLPGFVDLERQAAVRDMDRVAHTLQREIDLLGVTARDWGNWGDTFAFMQTRDPLYVTTNLGDSRVTLLRANVLAFVALDGRYAWSVGRETKSARTIDIDLLTAGALPEGHPWRAAVTDGEFRSGMLQTSQGAMLAVLAPILDGKGQGPHRGMVLLGRLLTAAELARIGDQAQVHLTNAPATAMPSTGTQRSDTVSERESVTEVIRTFDDVAGRPAVTLRIEVPRAMSAYGLQVIRYAMLILVLGGATVLVLITVVLDRSVLSPLSRLTQHIVRIARTDDLGSRLDVQRSDELGDLAREFDHMVARLADARRQLADQSFRSGIAENASGVLHNLGNALTPLGVDVAALREKLADAPAGDIDLVLAELEQCHPGEARRMELEAYLRLTSRELAATLTGAIADLSGIAQNTQAMQRMLAEQVPRSTSERHDERISLTELVERSAALVAPTERQRLSIEMGESLQAIGEVRLPRTTLQQVVQNLILNAAESVRDSGRARGSLQIAAQLSGEEELKVLRLSFADDGVGVARQNLARIFERGFTTKPARSNAGIGLHWCANAIMALGGEISVDSPGPLGGAIFHVMLPLGPISASAISEAA